MQDSATHHVSRIPVGTHFRVWWLWLPLILGALGLLATAALLPVLRPLAVGIGMLAVCLLIWAALSCVVILRGQRWLEQDHAVVRIIDREGTFEFPDQQVTDLALFRVLHHAGGRLIAVTRELVLWIETSHGQRQLRLVNRMRPHSIDPLEELIDRLRNQLLQRAADTLSRGGVVDGEGWKLAPNQFQVTNGAHKPPLAIESVAAVETVGQEVRIWQAGVPRAVIRLPLSGRNTWMIDRLLPIVLASPPADDLSGEQTLPSTPLGRILFERMTGPAVSILFATIGLVIAAVGVMTVFLSMRAADPFGMAVGILLGIVGAVCLIGALRVRRIRFCCHEHGLERVTLTGRQVLPFAEVDVFSFESHRNHSHGRYTGTTYTLVFADRTREHGRGIFFSTTVHNTDEELELLRERVSEQIARRLAASFARRKRVQWTPELWFREDVLEFARPRRLLSGPKLAVIPYDTVTNFEIRDGLFHLWTNYQERAIISIKTSTPNFYPGLIVFEGLTKAHVRSTVDDRSMSTTSID